MGTVILFFGSLLFYCAIMKSCGQPLASEQETQEVFVTKTIRVKRQAGYVYDRPGVSFELPTKAPTVSTQASTAVDRTMEQMMYYAYPVPAAPAASTGGGVTASGGSVGSAAGSSSSSSGAAGYNYAPQNAASVSTGAQSTSITTSSQTSSGSSQSSSSASGYGYNAPATGSGSITNGYQSTIIGSQTNAGSAQSSSSAGSSQGSSNSGAGYNYEVPKETLPLSEQGSGQTVDSSTSAPRYLPPQVDGGSSNAVATGSSSASVDIGVVSTGSKVSALPSDQYLPPTQPNTPVSLAPSNSSGGPVTGVSSSYIPPSRAPSNPGINATPRPFSPAPPPTGYLPPNINSGTQSQNSPDTPASTYLPPVI